MHRINGFVLPFSPLLTFTFALLLNASFELDGTINPDDLILMIF
jgi:hypothetical protein